LKDYDYSQAGAYFVAVCTHNRECLFGEIRDGEMRLNDPGIMVISGWEQLNERFPEVKIDAYVVMPNHIHGIIWLVGAPLVGAPDGGIRATARRAAHKGRPYVGGRHRGLQINYDRRIHSRGEDAGMGSVSGPPLAAQLLRTRYPQREDPERHSRIY